MSGSYEDWMKRPDAAKYGTVRDAEDVLAPEPNAGRHRFFPISAEDRARGLVERYLLPTTWIEDGTVVIREIWDTSAPGCPYVKVGSVTANQYNSLRFNVGTKKWG